MQQKNFNVQPMFIGYTLLYVVLLAYWGVLQFLPEKGQLINHMFTLSYAFVFLVGGGLCMWASKHIDDTTALGKMFFWWGLGIASWGMGNIPWVYYNVISKVEIPYPSLADLFYVLFIVFAAIGCFYLISIARTQLRRRLFIEAMAVFTLACAAIFGFITQPTLSLEVPWSENLFNLLYPLGDAVLITMAVMIGRASGGKIQKGIPVLIIGLIFQTIADFLFSYRTAHEIYWNGDLSDFFWMTGGFIMSFGLLKLFESLRSTSGELPVNQEPMSAMPA